MKCWCCVPSLLWRSCVHSRSLLNFLCQVMWPNGQPWCGQKAVPISDKIGLLMALSCFYIPWIWSLLWSFVYSWICESWNGDDLLNLLCQLMWPTSQPWCGQKALPISDKTGLLMAFCCYDILSNWLLLLNLVISWKPSLLKCRWSLNLLAKWYDLLVNHDADRRLCQYLRKLVCWWHFPVLLSLQIDLIWFPACKVCGLRIRGLSLLAVQDKYWHWECGPDYLSICSKGFLVVNCVVTICFRTGDTM